MITIERLNSIPDRPSPLAEWKQFTDNQGQPGHFYIEDDTGFWTCTGIAILNEKFIEVSVGDLSPRHALQIAQYACKVEEEIEKWKSQSSS